MSKILVTGAMGLVGAEICSYLREKGHDVVGTVSQKHQENSRNMWLDLSVPGLDLSDSFHGIEGIVHTAAVVPNRKSNPNDERNKKRTMNIDQNIVRFCTAEDIPVVYISSCGMYDLKDTNEKNENSPLSEVSLYHSAKIIGESLFLGTGRAIVGRISSPYGLKISDEAVLKIFLSRAFNQDVITVWGTGQREQDFINIRDISCFVEKALFSGHSGVFNVCSGAQITMADLAAMCIKVSGGKEMKIRYTDDPSEHYYPRFSIKKAESILNWRPLISLEQGLANIIENWKEGVC